MKSLIINTNKNQGFSKCSRRSKKMHMPYRIKKFMVLKMFLIRLRNEYELKLRWLLLSIWSICQNLKKTQINIHCSVWFSDYSSILSRKAKL